MLKIKNKAIFISDAHEGVIRKGFWDFLQALKNKEIESPQLILMGDMFDVLVGEVEASHNFAKPYINLLEELALQMQIIYLEGNHDFNLGSFFKKVQVFPLQAQPLLCEFEILNADKFDQNDENLKTLKEYHFACEEIKSLSLAHGDIFLPPLLGFVLKALRNHYLLAFLNILDKMLNFKISKQIFKKQKHKNLFFTIENFKELARKRYEKYAISKTLVVEGHYHQNLVLDEKNVKYINLPSFAYERSFFIVECADKIKFQEKKLKEEDV
ncbi:UDP-2,3-diacylglucosamine diphosphatase [Campylobacter sp. MIT 99-7217]|uniref:UDP-2,3-diacylglucosamine diphosphatase n=1 Tax=Campylobacter sp. MIT 99-7217 TaxID=535091 RepID=UPI00391845E1